MAENKRPLITVDSPPRHINLATIKKQRISKPMASNNTPGGVESAAERLSVFVDTTRMQLISPPPEEMLRVYILFILCYDVLIILCGAAG
jgi:hypothetical protein